MKSNSVISTVTEH